MIIAIDFDGTIVEDAFPDIGEALPGAIETIKEWNKLGHSLILWTSRGYYKGVDYANDVKEWIFSNNLLFTFSAFNNESPNNPFNDTEDKQFSPKIYADIYIDDKALGFIKDWNWIKEQVEKHPKFKNNA